MTEQKSVRERLAMVEPMLSWQGPTVTLEWSGIEKQVCERHRRLLEPASRLTELTVSIWVNGVETVTGLPWGTNSYSFSAEPHGQVDYYVAYNRGKNVVHRSSFALKESRDGQQLMDGSFSRKYAGELLDVTVFEDLAELAPIAQLAKAAVELSYKKIVWVLRPTAAQATREFIEKAAAGVDVRAHFGAEGSPAHVDVIDRMSGIHFTHASPEDFFFKVDAAFNGNSFFWDDMFVALVTIVHHPWLVRSTLEFWLTVQQLNGGVIPREVRKSNLMSLFFSQTVLYGEPPCTNLVYTNPYLMNWVMDELYRFHPSPENEALLVRVAESIEQYAAWMETYRALRDANGKIVGFNGSALGTGADNSRGRLGNRSEPEAQQSGFVDFLAQHIQMHRDLAQWCEMLARKTANPFEQKSLEHRAAVAAIKVEELTATMNRLYWNEERGFYYDLIPCGSGKWKQNLEYTLIGGFWPLWAGVPNEEQQHCLIERQMVAHAFGGDFPFPANARTSIGEHKDPLYVPRPGDEEDGYWDKWAHWPPMAVMAIEGFRRAGHLDLARQYTLQFLTKIAQWSTTTVEESYGEKVLVQTDGSVTFLARAIQHAEHQHRADFAGWGKAPPVYGLYTVLTGENLKSAAPPPRFPQHRPRQRHV